MSTIFKSLLEGVEKGDFSKEDFQKLFLITTGIKEMYGIFHANKPGPARSLILDILVEFHMNFAVLRSSSKHDPKYISQFLERVPGI